MSLDQLDVATEQHRDRERMLAEAFRAGGSASAFGPPPTLPRGLVSALESLADLVRLAAARTRPAH